MKKLAPLFLSTALLGGLALAAVTPAGAAEDNARFLQRGPSNGPQMMQDDTDAPRRGPGMWGQDAGMRMGGAGIFALACSDNAAPRLEIALNNLSGRLTLTDDQKTLFDAFKTSALTAATTYSDACEAPVADATTPASPVEALKRFETNATAHIAAIDAVLPSLEAFYASLSDEQKAEMTVPPRDGMQVGRNTFGPGQGLGSQDDFQPGQGRGMGPDQDGFGPGQGPGNGRGANR